MEHPHHLTWYTALHRLIESYALGREVVTVPKCRNDNFLIGGGARMLLLVREHTIELGSLGAGETTCTCGLTLSIFVGRDLHLECRLYFCGHDRFTQRLGTTDPGMCRFHRLYPRFGCTNSLSCCVQLLLDSPRVPATHQRLPQRLQLNCSNTDCTFCINYFRLELLLVSDTDTRQQQNQTLRCAHVSM